MDMTTDVRGEAREGCGAIDVYRETKAVTPRDVFERIQERRAHGDANGIADLFAPNGIMEFPFAGDGMTLPSLIEGREQIRHYLVKFMNKWRRAGRRIVGYEAVVVHETSDPEVIIAEFDLAGEVSSGGKIYSFPYIQVLRIRDGAILSLRDYF